jgi:FkbM family methyltransferase
MIFDWGSTSLEYINLFTKENFIDRTYEKHGRVKAGDIVVDIGANCGSFTYSILGREPAHVYCVEPSNTLIHALRTNMQNGPVTIINKAISDAKEDNKVIAKSGVYIYENEGNTYDTISFKNLIEENNISRIDFLKFDCEGGEYSIFTKENYNFIRTNVKHYAGEWHITDHENAVERFIEYRDLYLEGCLEVRVYERAGDEVTHKIWDNDYLYSFRDWWKNTYFGQFLIYVTH